MTNEELAVEIQNGQTDLLLTLWDQNKRFIYGVAHTWKRAFNQISYFDVDDLVQAAWLALMDAVKYYKDDSECGFLTVYKWFINRQFRKVIGISTSKRDALFYAEYSLDSPITDDDPGGDTFGDTVPDFAASDAFIAVEDKIVQARMRSTLDTVAGELLNDRQWEVYQGLLNPVHGSGVTRSQNRQWKKAVFQILRNDPRILQLWLDVTERDQSVSEIAEYYMQRAGIGNFRDRCASSVELAVERIIKNDLIYRNKGRRLKKVLGERLHAADDKTVDQKKRWQRQIILSDLKAFECGREKRLAEGK